MLRSLRQARTECWGTARSPDPLSLSLYFCWKAPHPLTRALGHPKCLPERAWVQWPRSGPADPVWPPSPLVGQSYYPGQEHRAWPPTRHPQSCVAGKASVCPQASLWSTAGGELPGRSSLRMHRGSALHQGPGPQRCAQAMGPHAARTRSPCTPVATSQAVLLAELTFNVLGVHV